MIVDCKIHGTAHANCMCPDRDDEECAREMLGFVLDENEVELWFKTPNEQIGGLTPMQAAYAFGAGIVRDLVRDMIFGNPI